MRQMVEDEIWQQIPEFPDYSISTLGRVHNDRTGKFMTPSRIQTGHLKISLEPARHTRSVALLVAEAFIEPPDRLSDCVVLKDGNLDNVTANNIVWRPRWFALRYSRQMTQLQQGQQPLHYRNIAVRNIDLRIEYDSIIEAGISEGVLFDDIWDSTYLGRRPYPFHHKYRIVERV